MKRIFLLGVLVIFFTHSASGRNTGFNKGYDKYGCYYYQPVGKWEEVRRVNYGERACYDSLLLRLKVKPVPYVICPWWYEDVYRQLPEPVAKRIGRIGYVGYVLNPATGGPWLSNAWNNTDCVLNDSVWQRVPFDLVVYCRSAEDLDRFLLSSEARHTFLQAVFSPATGAINRQHHGQKPTGIHFYLPEVSFREKRSLLRFIQSVSIVMDAYEVNGNRMYEGDKCSLTITFSPEARQEMNYVSGILEYADAVYFARYDAWGVPDGRVEKVDRFSDPTSVLYRIRNQLYLLRWDVLQQNVYENGSADFSVLMKAGYTDSDWLIYFYIGLVMVSVFLLSVVLYYVSSHFYMFVHRLRVYIFPIVIVFITEIFILFLLMIESFSRYPLLLNMDSSESYLLPLFPLTFVFIYMAFRSFYHTEKLP